MKNLNKWAMSGLLAGLLPGLSWTVAAQDDTNEDAASDLTLFSIVVTAERREATLQDIPISVSALSGASLEEASVFDTEFLSYQVPGLVIQRDVVGKAVIRGIGTENFTVGGDPGVATYVDGAYIARSSVGIFDFFDIERVEVLRGPQATLYGRNATGGVINVISRSPTDEFESHLNLTAGHYNTQRIDAAISGPLGDGVRARLAGLHSSRDGFTQNIFPNIGQGLDELDTKDLWALRGRLDIDLGADTTLELIGDLYRDDSNPPAFWYTDDSLPWQGPNSEFPRDLRTISQGYETQTPGFTNLQVGQANRQDQTGLTGRLSWNFDNFTLTSTTVFRDTEFDWINDGDGLSDYLVVYYQRDESEQFTQDIQLTSNSAGAFEWIAGAFYLTEDSIGDYAIPLGPAFGSATILYDGTNETNAYGLFFEGRYSIGDLAVTFGARYSDEEKDATLDYVISSATLAQFEESASFDALTPRLVVEYAASDEVMLYGSATQGFKSGGFSLLDNPLNSFDQEDVWAYEIGAKSRLLDNRVELNAAAFYYDYSDQQLSQVTNLATQTTNAGSSTIQGLEAEFKALLSGNFQIDGNLAYLDAEFDEFCTIDTRDTTRPIDMITCNGAPNLAGNSLPRAPELQSNLSATYSNTLESGLEGFIRAEWQYTGDQFFSVFNRPNIAQDSFSVLNASAGISKADGSWSVRIWARNLADEEYFSNLFESGVLDTVVVPQGFVAPPRTLGVTLSFAY